MVSKLKCSIAKHLLDAQVAIDGALTDAGFLAALSTYGYDEARLREGRELYEEAIDLVNRQAAAQGEQLGATARLRATWDEARTAYRRTLKVARVAFKSEHKARVALMLRGRRQQGLAGWLEQAEMFYGNLLSKAGWLAAMAEFGFERERLEAERALVQKILQADSARRAAQGKAVQATIQRDAKLRELGAWMADFRVVAGIAAEEQLRERDRS